LTVDHSIVDGFQQFTHHCLRISTSDQHSSNAVNFEILIGNGSCLIIFCWMSYKSEAFFEIKISLGGLNRNNF